MKLFPLAVLLAIVSCYAWGTDADIKCHDTNPCNPTAPVIPPGTAEPAFGIFFDCGNTTGTNAGTLANPYKTLDKTNVAAHPDGTDIWLKTGSACDLQVLTRPAWKGVVSAGEVLDPLTIGTYYVSAGVAYVDAPSNFSPTTRPADYLYPNGARASIAGAYKETCRNSTAYGGLTNKCPWSFSSTYRTTNWAQAVPSDTYAALINVDGIKGAVVQDLEIKESSGFGINMQSNPHVWCLSNNPACANYSKAWRNLIHHTALNGVGAGYSSNNVVSFNEFHHTNICIGDGLCQNGLPGPAGGSDVSVTGCFPCLTLQEGNDSYYSWGENTGVYGVGFVLIRGQVSASSRANGAGTGSSDTVVLEQNEVLGGIISDPPVAAAGGPTTGSYGPVFWTYGYENPASGPLVSNYNNGGVPGKHVLRRNNIGANPTQKCLHTYIATAVPAVTMLDILDIGNTCIVDVPPVTTQLPYGPSYAFNGQYDNVDPTLKVVNQDNMYVSTAASCDTSPKNGLAILDYNLWTTQQTSSVCRGVHDVVGGSGLGTIGTYTWTNRPNPLVFKPSASGAGRNVGIAMTATLTQLQSANWDWVLSQRYWLPACNTTGAQVPRAEWNKQLTTDFCGNPRTTADMGAFEY